MLYSNIIDPETKTSVNITDPKFIKIVLKYLHQLKGGGKTFRPVNQIEYLLKDSIVSYIENYEKTIYKGLELFIKTSIKEDIKEYLKLKNALNQLDDVSSSDLHSIQSLASCKAYCQLFIIELHKTKLNMSYNSSHTFINNLQKQSDEYAKGINHIKILIKDLTLKLKKQERSKEPKNIPAFLEHTPNKPKLSMRGGKPDRELYTHMRRILENAAEPMHDFGGDRAREVSRYFNSKYRGTKVNGHAMKEGVVGAIKKIDTKIEIFKKSGFLKRLLYLAHFKRRKNPVSMNTLLGGSGFEANMFSKLHSINDLALVADNFFFGKFSYLSLVNPSSDEARNDKSINSSFIQYVTNKSAITQGPVIDDPTFNYYSFFQMLLTERNIDSYIMDSNLANLNFSGIRSTLEDNEINKITPLVNIWDPASASKSDFTDGILAADDVKEKMTRTYLENGMESSTTKVWKGPQRSWDSRKKLFSVSYNNETDEPVKLTIHNKSGVPAVGNDVLLNTGFSVKDISSILEYIITAEPAKLSEFKEKYDDDTDDVKQLKLLELAKAIFLAYSSSKGNGIIAPTQTSTIIKLLLDMKKTGDWSQIYWLRKYNEDRDDGSKTAVVSNDRLFCLWSILNFNPTIFSTTREMTNIIPSPTEGAAASESSIETRPLMLGLFSGKQLDYTKKLVLSELKIISELSSNNENLSLLTEYFRPKDDIIAMVNTNYSNLSAEFSKNILQIQTDDDKFRNFIPDDQVRKDNVKLGAGSTIFEVFFSNETGIFTKNLKIITNKLDSIDDDDHVFNTSDKETIQKCFQQLKLILNIFKSLNELLFYKLRNISEFLTSIEKNIFDNLVNKIFDSPSSAGAILEHKILFSFEDRDDENSIFDTDGLKAEEHRRGRRLSTRIDSFKNDFTWFNTNDDGIFEPNDTHDVTDMFMEDSAVPVKLLTIKEYKEKCDWYANLKLKDSIGDVAKVIADLSNKILNISSIEYLYSSFPNIYSTLVSQIGQLDDTHLISRSGRRYARRREDINVSYIKVYCLFILHNHFTGDDNENYECEEDSTSESASFTRSGDGQSENISIKLSNSMSFLSCIYQKLDEGAAPDEDMGPIKDLFDSNASLFTFLNSF